MVPFILFGLQITMIYAYQIKKIHRTLYFMKETYPVIISKAAGRRYSDLGKKKRTLPVLILGITILITGSFFVSKVDAISDIKSMGELFREQKASQDNDTVVIEGNNITITEKEIEDKAAVYLKTGDVNPVDSAVQHLLERKVLYNKAISGDFQSRMRN